MNKKRLSPKRERAAFLLSFFNLAQPKRGIAVIIVGLLVMKLNNRIVLALDGVIMCLMA